MCAAHDMQLVHYFNTDDQATEASRRRRAITPPYPGNAVVTRTQNLECICCDGARTTTFGHDYGRSDGHCLLDERDFLAGEPPEARCLQPAANGTWKLMQ